jgi:hypothetical protein
LPGSGPGRSSPARRSSTVPSASGSARAWRWGPHAWLALVVERHVQVTQETVVAQRFDPWLTIGAGAVVEHGSVVTRDVPPRAVVAGDPAHVVRTW